MMKAQDTMPSLKDNGLSRKGLLGRISYFDILEGMVALAMAIACLAIANRSSWVWNYKDSLALGLFLGTILVCIVLRRGASTQRIPSLRACVAASTVAAMVVLFRRWHGMWLGVAVLTLLFALCLRSKTVGTARLREDSYRVLLVLGGILFTLILAEGSLRLIPELLPEGARARVWWQAAVEEPWHVSHPYFGHLLNLEHLRMINTRTRAKTAEGWQPARFDRWGFRNAEPWPDRADILTVGDSWTYSVPVTDEQAWPEILDRALAPRRILNLGLPGAGPQQYLRLYETFGAGLFPKVLLVGLPLRSDLGDALSFDAWLKSESTEGLMEFRMKKLRSGIKGWLVGKSYLYTLLNDMHASYKAGVFLQAKTVRLADGNRIQFNPRALASVARLSYPGQPAFELVLETLEQLQALATHQQTHCLVLFFPSKEEVYLPVFGEAAADLAAPFLPELDKRGIAYLDLGPHFRQRAAAGETLFWEVDSHPNVEGYALIAEVVLAHLRRHAARFGLD